jgi:hypothetical protein
MAYINDPHIIINFKINMIIRIGENMLNPDDYLFGDFYKVIRITKCTLFLEPIRKIKNIVENNQTITLEELGGNRLLNPGLFLYKIAKSKINYINIIDIDHQHWKINHPYQIQN